MEKWIFFAESAPLPRSSRHARDPEEARAIPARGVSSRSSRQRDCRTPFGPRRRSRAPRSTPDLSPDPKFREARHFLVVASTMSERSRPPSLSAEIGPPLFPDVGKATSTSSGDLLRTLFGLAPPNSHSTMVSNSSFSTLPFVGGEEDARDFIRDKYEAHRRAASRTSLAPRTTPPSQHPPRHPPPLERFHRSHPPLGRSSPDRARRRGSRGFHPREQLPTDGGEAEDTTGSGVEPEMIRGSGGHDGFGGVARNREGNDGIERATRHTRTFAADTHAPPTRSSFLRARASNPTLLLVLVIVRLEREGNRLSFPVHFRLRRGRRGRRESVGASNLRRHLLCRPTPRI